MFLKLRIYFQTRNEPMAPIQESDFELTEQEKNAQILALETLRRKTRRRLNRSDLRYSFFNFLNISLLVIG